MPAFFSDSTIEQIRGASDIVDVIGSYVPLKRAGANFVALCPFHREKSPSFNVNPQRQSFHCFGCHKGGSVFNFVMEYESIPFPDAVRRLAERAKITLEVDNNPAHQVARNIKDSLLLIHEQITQRWQSCLANEAAAEPAREYLKKRGVAQDAIELFRLGYAPDVWDDTVNWSKSKKYDLALMEQSGLILKKDAGGHYDRFRGRLMFPICDEQGRVIGFSGRVLDAEAKTAKYINSPETPIFTKGKVFFGLDKSKRALLAEKSAIVCEGQLDLIRCFTSGVQNIVAPQGTALTADHTRILKRYVDEVVLCFDSDNAGQNAAVRSLDSLLASGLAIRVAVVPAPHDPDSFIKANGGDAFKQIVAKASGFFDYYLNRLCDTSDLATDKGRLNVLESIGEAVHKTGNGVLIDTYAQKTALRLGVQPDAVRAEFRKVARTKKSSLAAEPDDAYDEEVPEELSGDSEPELPKPSTLDMWILRLTLLVEDSIPWARQYLNLDWIQHPQVRELISQWLAMHQHDAQPTLAGLLDHCESGSIRRLLTEVTVDNRVIPNAMQQLGDVALRLRNQAIDREFNLLRQRLGNPSLTSEELHEINAALKELPARKRQPLISKVDDNIEPF